MSKKNHPSTEQMQESVLSIDMNQLTLDDLTLILKSRDDEIVLNSNKRSVIFDTSNPMDKAMLKELVHFAKVKGGIDARGHVFSPQEADELLRSAQMLQKEQKVKLAAFQSLLNGSAQKRPTQQRPPVVTPPTTPDRPKRPRSKSPPPRPQKPKKAKKPWFVKGSK